MRAARPLIVATAVALGAALLACGGGGGSSAPAPSAHPPALSNFTYTPTRLPVRRGGTGTVESSLDFVDSGGDVVEFRIASSDGSTIVLPGTGLAGITSARVRATFQVNVDNPVDLSFETWAIDGTGASSNRLRGTFQVYLDDTATSWQQVASFTGSGGPAYGLSGLAWTGSQYVGVGVAGTVRTSPNARDWTLRPTGVTQFLKSVAWSGSQLVAVGNDALSYVAIILSSPDGQAWTVRYTPPTVATRELNKVIWTGSQFVAVGHQMIAGQEFGLVLVSTDGLNWTERAQGQVPGYMQSVAASATALVAVGRGVWSEPAIWSSVDGGVTWTRREPSTGAPCCIIADVAYGNGRFVAAGGGNGSRAYVSADGMSWQTSATTFPTGLSALAVGATRYVAIGIVSSLFTSPDGIQWTEVPGGPAGSCKGAIVWDGKAYVAVYLDACQSP